MGVIPEVEEGLEAERAGQLARRLGLPLLRPLQQARDLSLGQAVLQMTDGVPMIQLTGRGVPGPVTVDFADKTMAQRRRAGHNELLGKAVGWKQAHAPRVLDGTGGFGRDAFLLADLGCEVAVCERNLVMAALFEAALSRAAGSGDDWLVSVVHRITVHHQDAQSVAPSRLEAVEVIYLDPMFPLDRRAAPAKEMQILHKLLNPGERLQGSVPADSSRPGGEFPSQGAEDRALLQWARAQDVKRVVVKRPRRAPAIDGPPPGHSLTGKAVRFDVYPVFRET
ncbi:class I SAM-dependent methyltransferase [Congregibacter sp.]|uniref:class I SAM-dependent methyltransferase n=1 Tax=Congregibacter sp. TaxID=2744308 RepID=UPI003F6B8C75